MFVRPDFMFGRGYSPRIYTNIFNLNFFPDYVSQNEFTQHKISQKQVKEFHSDPWWWGPCAPPCGPTPPPWAPHCCLLLPDLATSHLLLLLDCLCAPPPRHTISYRSPMASAGRSIVAGRIFKLVGTVPHPRWPAVPANGQQCRRLHEVLHFLPKLKL